MSLSSSAAPTGDVKPAGDYKIALITMDSIDQHWITLKEGAEKVAKELGVELVFMAPNTKDDAQQIEQVNNAVAAGCNAIIVAANGPDAISSALKEAEAAGVKIVYVDSPANVEAEATFSTDNTAAGKKTAGETMLKALTDKGITSGKIGIVNVNAATASCVAGKTASAPPSNAPASSCWRPSTVKATPPSLRALPRTTSLKALWASSAATKAPTVPAMRSRQRRR